MVKMKRMLILLFCTLFCVYMFACAKNEEQLEKGKSRIPCSESSFKGKQYDSVIADLGQAGFTNISSEILYDVFFGIITKEGEVESVVIDGNKDYHKGDIVDSDIPIIVTYHLLNEDDPADRTYYNTVYDRAFCWSGKDGLRASSKVYYFFSESDHTVLRVSHSSAGKGRTNKSYGTYTGSFDGIITIKLNNKQEEIEFVCSQLEESQYWNCEGHLYCSTEVKYGIQMIKNWH